MGEVMNRKVKIDTNTHTHTYRTIPFNYQRMQRGSQLTSQLYQQYVR